MSSSAHIYTPEDDSLEARIHAYKTMRNELSNIKASQKLSQNKEWQDRLGTQEELQQAHNIIKNSLSATLNNISSIDLQKAQEQGLMTSNEVSELEATKEGFGKQTDSKQTQIDKNKSEIRKARASSISKDREIDNER